MARKSAAEVCAEREALALAAHEAHLTFLATKALPWMFRLQELAKKLKFETTVELTEEGVKLSVFDAEEASNHVVSNYDSEEWEFMELEHVLTERKEQMEVEARQLAEARLQLSQLKNQLSPEVLKLLAKEMRSV